MSSAAETAWRTAFSHSTRSTTAPAFTPLGANLAIADQFDRMAAAAQGFVRRARLQPRDHAGDLAGADVERSHQRGALLRHRTRLRRLLGIEAGHASPTFFFGSFFLSASSRDFAASSDSCTTSRSGRRRSIATMSLAEQVLVLVELAQGGKRVADVVFGQADVEAVIEAQVPAPFADERRSLGHGIDLRIARRAAPGNPWRGFRRPCPPPAAA